MANVLGSGTYGLGTTDLSYQGSSLFPSSASPEIQGPSSYLAGLSGYGNTGIPSKVAAESFPALTTPSYWDSFKNSFFGSTDTKTGIKTQGTGDMLFGAAAGIGNMLLGMRNYGLAKDTFNFQRDMANKNYEAQKGLINADLEDRQKRRVQENPNATSVADYMAKYGVK